jgi:hypothetical protein
MRAAGGPERNYWFRSGRGWVLGLSGRSCRAKAKGFSLALTHTHVRFTYHTRGKLDSCAASTCVAV